MNSFLLLLLLLLLLPHCYYSLATATVVQITFKEMMTAILTLLLGALGIGQSLMDMGDQRLGLQAATRIFQSIEEGKLSMHSIVRTLHYYATVRLTELVVLSGESEVLDGLSTQGRVPEAACEGRIELKGVCFAYPTRPDVPVSNIHRI